MIKIENHIGTITISEKYLADLIGYTVTNCFGVTDVNDAKLADRILSALKRKGAKNKISKGVSINTKDNTLSVDLHITVAYGTNITVITDSIINKVKFAIEDATGINVAAVNVFVDNINI